MVKNSVVDSINRRLKIHGSNQYGEPNFRVVFSDDQLESRKGVFDIHENGRFIRTESGIKELPKYPWVKSKWIIERWAPGDISYHKSLVTVKDGTYICVYVFQDKDRNYLPPLYKVCEIVIKALLNPRNKFAAINEDKEMETKFEAAEVDKIELGLKEKSDEEQTKDPNSIRESLSVGYGEEKRRIR